MVDIHDASIPAGNLHTGIAEIGEPFADVLKRIEWRYVAQELSQKYGRPLNRSHGSLPRTTIIDAPQIQAGFGVKAMQPLWDK